jgi:hypothetical protein
MKDTIQNWLLHLKLQEKLGKITEKDMIYSKRILENWQEVYEVYKKQGRIK